MKAIIIFILSSFLAVSVIAQTTSTVNITFRGINKGTSNYQVMIDETSYYSNNNSTNVPNYKITLNNLITGTHALKVYKLKNNNPAYNTRSQNRFVYSKNFELRQGYDMNITVLPTGRVQFSEQVSPLDNTIAVQMADSDFRLLVQNVQNKRTQSLRAGVVRDAFANTDNYFSTAQIRQLLTFVTSESIRLDLAKLSFRSVTDPSYFAQLSNLFSISTYRNDFNTYVSTYVGQSNTTAKVQMPAYEFNQLLQNIQSKWSQSLKAETERDALINTSNYFSTAQIRQLLALVASENDRMDLVKLSYRGVIDPVNFHQLADLFNSSSFRNEFINYANLNSGQTNTVVKTQMTDYQFNQLLQNVKNQWSQSLKGGLVRDAFTNTNNYFNTAQIRQLLTSITSESDRMDLVKLSYRGVIDPVNFHQLADLFNSSSFRNEFINYANLSSGTTNTTVKTQMTDYQFNQLLQNVKNQWSQSLKGGLVRDAFTNTNNYFNTAQIRQLLTSITSESDRMDLVKLSYRGVIDPVNFHQLADLFNSSSFRNEFINYANLSSGTTNTTVKMQMTDYQFNQLLQNVKNQWSQSLKGELEREAFTNTNNYFSTAQIRQLLTLMTYENDRLDLAKLSYRSVMDPANFAQLSDLFNTNANKNDFNNYIIAQGGQVLIASVKTPMSDSDFSVLVLSIRSNLLQVLKVSAEKDVFNNPNSFFTANQAKQLISLINSESNRLELAKLSYRTLTDPVNFTLLNDLFTTQASKDALANYVKANQIQ